jgi:hypothetical protein
VGYLRDFGVRQALEVVQHHDRALGERQRGQGTGDRVHGQVALSLQGGLTVRIGDVVQEVGVGGGPAAGDFVERPPGDDLVQPGGKR